MKILPNEIHLVCIRYIVLTIRVLGLQPLGIFAPGQLIVTATIRHPVVPDTHYLLVLVHNTCTNLTHNTVRS